MKNGPEKIQKSGQNYTERYISGRLVFLPVSLGFSVNLIYIYTAFHSFDV